MAYRAQGKPRGGADQRWFIEDAPLVHCAFKASLRSRAAEGSTITNLVALLGVIPAAAGLALFQSGGLPGSVSRLVVRDEVILRVPVQPRPAMPRFNWKEHKGPSCIPVRAIRRALLSGPDQVDFILGNGSRVRAKFEKDCPALDFYGNFYLEPSGPQLCIERDAIHSRMGGSCPIKRFRLLEPRLPR